MAIQTIFYSYILLTIRFPAFEDVTVETGVGVGDNMTRIDSLLNTSTDYPQIGEQVNKKK